MYVYINLDIDRQIDYIVETLVSTCQSILQKPWFAYSIKLRKYIHTGIGNVYIYKYIYIYKFIYIQQYVTKSSSNMILRRWRWRSQRVNIQLFNIYVCNIIRNNSTVQNSYRTEICIIYTYIYNNYSNRLFTNKHFQIASKLYETR